MCLDVNANLFTLVSQLDTFINGSATTKVHTKQGAILTLSGLIEKLQRMPMLQKVVDFPDLLTARGSVGTALLPFGAIARVTNDPTPGLNGLYEAKDTGDLQKIDYVEVTGLIQPDMLDKTFGSDEIMTNPVVIYSRPVPLTNSHKWITELDIKVEFTTHKPGAEGIAMYQYTVLAQVEPDDTLVFQQSALPGLSTIGVHGMPELKGRVTKGLNSRALEVYFEPFTDDVELSPFVLKTRTTAKRESLI